jgi:alpha-L-arabinofuranosidase
LLAAHPMTHTRPATQQFGPVFYVAGVNEPKGSHIWKGAVYNTTDGADVDVTVTFEDLTPGTRASLTLLTGNGDPYAYNDPHTGVNIVNSTTSSIISNSNAAFQLRLPQWSVAVLDTCIENEKRGPVYETRGPV